MKAKTKRPKAEIYVEPVIPMETLAWPTEPEPEPVEINKWLEGKPYGTLFVGWWMNGYYSDMTPSYARVGKGCSSGHLHSTRSTTKTDSQRCGVFYATKKDAVLALRWVWCRRFAKALHEAANINTDEL